MNRSARAGPVLNEFKLDKEDFEYIEGLAGIKTKKCQDVLNRSLFHKTSVQQQVQMAVHCGWWVSRRQADTSKRQASHLLQTQIIEDINGTQKNNPGTMAVNRFKRPMASMMSTLQSNVLTTRHKFKTVNADIPLPKKVKLDVNYFEADPEMQSLPFEDIANVEAQADFYSPKSENSNVLVGG